MNRKINKKLIVLICMSLLLFTLISIFSTKNIELDNKQFINRLIYSIVLYLWALWMYIGKHRFYQFFTTFVLVVYAFGFISFLFVSSFNYLTISQILLAVIGIIINVSVIIILHRERKIIND